MLDWLRRTHVWQGHSSKRPANWELQRERSTPTSLSFHFRYFLPYTCCCCCVRCYATPFFFLCLFNQFIVWHILSFAIMITDYLCKSGQTGFHESTENVIFWCKHFIFLAIATLLGKTTNPRFHFHTECIDNNLPIDFSVKQASAWINTHSRLDSWKSFSGKKTSI